ncbi:tyrosine-type recombinase/integrase [Neptuniibacter marinus]|uniref:tyrosine-type recombinase/integrase n=1 Tax=Neptuniibacter marinus TaxID=1806670 RepID=UPI003B5B9E65
MAGIENFRWNDLRHTWTSQHVQNVTHLYVLKDLGGWKTLAMVEKYAHIAPKHLGQYVENARVKENGYGTSGLEKKGTYLRKRPFYMIPRVGFEPARP